MIEIWILWVYYAIPFGFSLFYHFGVSLLNILNFFVLLKIKDQGPVPEMRIIVLDTLIRPFWDLLLLQLVKSVSLRICRVFSWLFSLDNPLYFLDFAYLFIRFFICLFVLLFFFFGGGVAIF